MIRTNSVSIAISRSMHLHLGRWAEALRCLEHLRTSSINATTSAAPRSGLSAPRSSRASESGSTGGHVDVQSEDNFTQGNHRKASAKQPRDSPLRVGSGRFDRFTIECRESSKLGSFLVGRV